MPDTYDQYLAAVSHLAKEMEPASEEHLTFLALQGRLATAIKEIRHFGPSDNSRAELNRVLLELNRVCVSSGRSSFLEICGIEDQLPGSPPKVLHNLPQPDYGTLVGREEQIEKILLQLRPYPDSQIPLVCIEGIGGIGKSSLALECAYSFLRRTQAGAQSHEFRAVVWTSAKANRLTAKGEQTRANQTSTLRDIFSTISFVLEREEIRRANEHDQLATVCRALAQIRTLLIIDNFESINDPCVDAFLRELPAPTKAIITSRFRFDAAYPVRLTEIGQTAAVNLISHEAERKQVQLDDQQKKELADHTNGIPLAIVWSIGQVAMGESAASVIARLDSDTNDIVRYCYEGIASRIKGRDSHRLLLALSMFDVDASPEALGSISGLGENGIRCDAGLAELETLSLVSRTPHRYAMLPLTRQFSTQLREAEANESLEQSWKTWMAAYAKKAHLIQWYEFDAASVREEIGNIQGAMTVAENDADWSLFLQLVPIVCWYHVYSGNWTELLEKAQQALEIARAQQDIEREIELRYAFLGWSYAQRNECKLGLHQTFEALSLCRRHLESPITEAIILIHLAQIHRKNGNLVQAEQSLEESRELLLQIAAERVNIAYDFEVGKLCQAKRDWQGAYARFKGVFSWLEAHPDDIVHRSHLYGAVLAHLALVEFHLEDYSRAQQNCEESLEIFREKRTFVALGPTHWRLALILWAQGDSANALDAVDEALIWYNRLGMLADLQKAQELREEIRSRMNNT